MFGRCGGQQREVSCQISLSDFSIGRMPVFILQGTSRCALAPSISCCCASHQDSPEGRRGTHVTTTWSRLTVAFFLQLWQKTFLSLSSNLYTCICRPASTLACFSHKHRPLLFSLNNTRRTRRTPTYIRFLRSFLSYISVPMRQVPRYR